MPHTPAVNRGARKRPLTERPTPHARRWFQVLVLFIASLVVANAVVGDRGLIRSMAARRDHDALVREIALLRSENAALQTEARRLTEDPVAVEEIARGELGLISPGEIVFLLNDDGHLTRRPPGPVADDHR